MVLVPQDLFDEADRLEERGESACALGKWRELAISNPTANVFLRLAGCAKDLGNLAEAETALKRVLDIDDRSALALAQLGIMALEREDYHTAESCLRKACDAAEDSGRFTLLGVAL